MVAKFLTNKIKRKLKFINSGGEPVVLVPMKHGILLKHSEDVQLSGLWHSLCTPEEAIDWIEELRSQWRLKKSTSSTR